MVARFVVLSTVLMTATVSLAANGRQLTYEERERAEAEQLCYSDVQTLCPNEIPDEDKITACMTEKRAQLSPECRKVFDRGIGDRK